MKILTKDWASKYEQLKYIHGLKYLSMREMEVDRIEKKSKRDFFEKLYQDEELKKLVINTKLADQLYNAYIERTVRVLNSFPIKVIDKIKNKQALVLGYACSEDRKTLFSYALRLDKEIEKALNEANRISEEVERYLQEEFLVDGLVGELVYGEFSRGRDYFINIGGRTVVIEDYEILEREDYKINEWEEDNPLSLWTSVYAVELVNSANHRVELHLLMVDGDKYENEKLWYFTIEGSNIKYEKKKSRD